MADYVCAGAMLTCTFGVAPTTLIPTPGKVTMSNMPAATIMDKEIANIPTFGMCSSPSNPAVAAATTAALGVLTPQPCVPVIPAPWVPGNPQCLIGGQPALTSDSKCMCAYGGEISITSPGQEKVESA